VTATMENTVTDVFNRPSLTEEELDACERKFKESLRNRMREQEQEWRAAGLTVSWIDTHPKWLSVCDWDTFHDDPLMKILTWPTEPCQRAWRFSLIGGGQIKITEHWVKIDDKIFPTHFFRTRNSKTTLAVAAHVDGKLHRRSGILKGLCYEMSAHAVVLHGAQDELTQSIADRAAATLRTLTPDESDTCTPPKPERFHALLDGASGCGICGRPLRDEISKLVGIGPNCARSWQIPHNMAAANRRLELRRQMLGEK
jgi:uncharacterized protein DUF6011